MSEPEDQEANHDADAPAEPDTDSEPKTAEPDAAEPETDDEGDSDEGDSDEGEAPDIDDLVAALGDGDGEGGQALDIADVAANLAAVEDAQRRAEAAGVELVAELPIDVEDDLSAVEGEASERLMSIIESMLFAAHRPLTVKGIRKVLKDPTANQVQLALKELISSTAERGVQVVQVAGGFVLRTNPENATWVQSMLQSRPVRLSRPQLETLAVIAYRQPVTKAEVDDIRGVDAGAVLKLLLEKDLIKIVGKKEEAGRPMLYGTTVFFLEFFNLMSLRDLPDLREFRELSDGTKEQLAEKLGEDEAEALGQEVLDFSASQAEQAAAEAAKAAEAVEASDEQGEDEGEDEGNAEGEAEGDADESSNGGEAPGEEEE